MPIVLSQNGLLLHERLIIEEYGLDYLLQLKKSLTVLSSVDIMEKKLRLYKVITTNGQNILLLPRFLTSKIREMFPDEKFINNIPLIKQNEINVIKCKDSFKLFNNQKLMIDELMRTVYTPENVANGTASCIAKMGTGQGKTFLSAALIGILKVKTLIIVHDSGMQNNEFSVVLKNTLDNLILCTKNKDELIEVANVVILVINTAMKKPSSFFKQFGLIIMDEIHMYCTEKRSEIFWNGNVQYVLGMSATPDENRNLFHKIAMVSVGKIIDVEQLPGYTFGDTFKANVRALSYYAPKEYIVHESNASSGRLMTHKTIMKALEDPYRDRLILQVLSKLLEDPRHNIYIFCQYRASVMHFYRLIKKWNDEKNTNDNNINNEKKNNNDNICAPELTKKQFVETFPMMGGITNEAYDNARIKGRIIIITYNYGGTGKSIPKMTAAIFASPMRAQWKQISGRILRLGSDVNIVREYIDIIDAGTILKYQFYGTRKDNEADRNDKTRRKTRKEVYEERGFPIYYETIHFKLLMTDEEQKEYNIVENINGKKHNDQLEFDNTELENMEFDDDTSVENSNDNNNFDNENNNDTFDNENNDDIVVIKNNINIKKDKINQQKTYNYKILLYDDDDNNTDNTNTDNTNTNIELSTDKLKTKPLEIENKIKEKKKYSWDNKNKNNLDYKNNWKNKPYEGKVISFDDD